MTETLAVLAKTRLPTGDMVTTMSESTGRFVFPSSRLCSRITTSGHSVLSGRPEPPLAFAGLVFPHGSPRPPHEQVTTSARFQPIVTRT